MARSSDLDFDNVLHFLQVKQKPVSFADLRRGLGVPKHSRDRLRQLLKELTQTKRVVEVGSGRFLTLEKAPQEPAALANRGALASRVSSSRNRETRLEQSGSARQEIRGRLVLHQDGYGFVVPDRALPFLAGDIYIARDSVEDAMHGDQVIAKISRLSGLEGAKRAEGRIVRVVARAHPSIVGLFRYTSRGSVVVPYDPRVQGEIELLAGEELAPALRDRLLPGVKPPGPRKRLPHIPQLDGAVVNAELVRYGRGGAAPTGRVVELLGRPGDLGVDTEIIIRKHHLPYTFPAEVREEADRRAQPVTERDRAGREDFRRLPIVTIDGETARDFDDAIHVSRREDGGWLLQVHIADVAHYVRPESPLDHEARLRGNSVYFIDRALPMLPEALSSGICSLNPHEERLVMSVLLTFDSSGRAGETRLVSGVICSAERMTYTNVNKVLQADPVACARYDYLGPQFRAMRDLAVLLKARREAHGSIDFDLPEPVIEFDAEQQMTSISRSERNMAHRIIEEFMLAANRAVAHALLVRGLKLLHRVHEKPDARKVLEFEELAQAFGYSLGVENLYQREIAVRHGKVPAPARAGRPETTGQGRNRPQRVALPGSDLRITPRHYQRLIEKLTGKPEERILSYLMLRSLKQARYSADALGHFALGFDEYTHFTSPIRRYPDLIVHRILKWALAHPDRKAPDQVRSAVGAEATLYAHGHLEELAAETSETERRAASAERELISWKTAQFMEQHLGDDYDALIVSLQKYGCFVELFDPFVEGLVPIGAFEEVAGVRCVYRERDHAIVAVREGPTRRQVRALHWKLGDRIRVRAERIDPMRRRVEFALVP